MADCCQTDSRKSSKVACSTYLIGLAILLLDQVSKWLTVNYIPFIGSSASGYPYGGIGVFENFLGIDFSLNYLTNTGAAWGAFGDHQMPLLVLRIGLITALCAFLWRWNRHPNWQIPLILIIAGAASNVLDYFLYGHVVDMFHFVFWGHDFPIFNVADSAISIGIVLLFFLSWQKS